MSKVWLVTGAAGGLGRHIAEAVLSDGDRLVAAARRPERLNDLAERYGDKICLVDLDVTDAVAGANCVQTALEAFGSLNVLVNNAGYGELAPFEQISDAAFRAVVESCFYGVVNMTRSALPVMRHQRSGHILQISSIAGRIGFPGGSAYSAAKWAVGGFTACLADEVTPFGIKVCCIEPGGMPTDWSTRALRDVPELLPEYISSVGATIAMIRSIETHDLSDLAKIAQVILHLARCDRLPAQLLLGRDAVLYATEADSLRAEHDRQWRDVSMSTERLKP